jgi:acyl carrier protein
MNDVMIRTCRIVSEVFDVPLQKVSAKTSKDDVEMWDSVNVVHLIMALEAEFGIAFTDDDTADMLSVELIVALLAEKGVA